MEAHIEFVFRPRNVFVRLIASLIGAPTCGIIRAGKHKDPFAVKVDQYESSAFFVAPNHRDAEIKALASPVRFSMYKAVLPLFAAYGLRFDWERHKRWGNYRVKGR